MLKLNALAVTFLLEATKPAGAAHAGAVRPAFVRKLLKDKLIAFEGTLAVPMFQGARGSKVVSAYKATAAGKRVAKEVGNAKGPDRSL